MRKIGIFIQSSNQELFKNNTEVLKEFYHSVIFENNLDVDLYSFTSDEKSSYVYEDGDTIYCACEDWNVYRKYYQLMDYIVCNKKYDYILFVNNSTLVNIKWLWDNINFFNRGYFCLINVVHPCIFDYPNGNFKLMSFDVFLRIYCYFKEAHDKYAPFDKFLFGEQITSKYMWHGVPEDLLMGICLFKIQMPYMIIPTELQLSLFESQSYRKGSAYEWNNILAINFRIPWDMCGEGNEYSYDLNYKYRLENETNILRQTIGIIRTL